MADALVQAKYSRRGAELRHEGQWAEALFTRAKAGGYYRTDTSSVEYAAGAGLDWFFRENWRINAAAQLASEGRAGNAGGIVVEAKRGMAKSL